MIRMAQRDPQTVVDWIEWIANNRCDHEPKTFDEIMRCSICSLILGIGVGGQFAIQEPAILRERLIGAKIQTGELLPVIGSEEGEA